MDDEGFTWAPQTTHISAKLFCELCDPNHITRRQARVDLIALPSPVGDSDAQESSIRCCGYRRL